MARKKSSKKAGLKSKERKKILELIDREEDRLSAEDLSNTVKELKSNPGSIQFLKGIAQAQEYSIGRRIEALRILQDLGKPVDEEFYSSLKAVGLLIEETRRFLKDSDNELPVGISTQVFELSDNLQTAFLYQIIREEGEQSLPLFTRLTGKSIGVDLIIAESLAYLPVSGSAELLNKMASGAQDKSLKKTIRRSLYRLKEKGVTVQDEGSKDSRIVAFQPPARVSEGYLSSIDHSGDRLVWLTRPKIPRGLYLFQVLISDTKGIHDFQGLEITKKMSREYLAMFKEGSPMPVVEADPSYCRFLIEEGHAKTTDNKRPLPKEYLEWSDKIGKPENEDQRPLIYSCYDEEAIKTYDYFLSRSESLFELPEFDNWVIPSDEIEKYIKLAQESNESKLVLTSFQKEERILKIYNDAVEEFFDEEIRLIYKRRLEEMAYVIYKLGKEEEAKICFVAALALKVKGVSSSPHPFLLGLIQRSISNALREEEEKEREDTSFIIKP